MSCCLRISGEELLEFHGGFQKTFSIHLEAASGVIERGFFTETGEGVREETIFGFGIKRRVACKQGELEMFTEITHELISAFLAPSVMTEEGE